MSLAAALPAGASEITFTGGTVTLMDNSTVTTDNDTVYYTVLQYDEDGFRVSYTDGGIAVGDYYDVGNDVMHTHWAPMNRYGTTEVRVARIDGAAFDLNAFGLTSNTALSGRPATGDEQVLIHASKDGVHTSYSMMLPPDDWGGTITNIALGAEFDNIKAFWFTPENYTDCFGIDNLVMEDAAPGQVPEPGSLALFVGAFAGLAWWRRQR